MRRYPYIDVARGIGMVLVVAGHAMGISMYLTFFYAVIFCTFRICVPAGKKL